MSDLSANPTTKRDLVTRQDLRLATFGIASLVLVAAVGLFVSLRKAEVVNSGRGEYGMGKGGGGGKNSPILVLGGAMTAFTTGTNTWIPYGADYCVDVDTYYIEFDNEAENLSEIWSNPTTPTSIVPWEVDIYGHSSTDHLGKTSSGNGLKFVSQKINCENQPGTSVVVSTINGGFYPPKSLPTTTKHTSNLRFLDNKQKTGCEAGNLATTPGDEDFCERMAEVDITINGAATPYTSKCLDGGCSVSIGTPK